MRSRLVLSHLPRTAYSTVSSPKAISQATGIEVRWPDGRESRFHYEYLLDHCRCASCYHPKTKQRLKTLVDFAATDRPSRVSNEIDRVVIDWPDNHVSTFPWDILARAAYDPPLEEIKVKRPSLWTSAISKRPPTVDYQSVMNKGPSGEQAVLRWLDLVSEYGFCFVEGVPADPEATETVIRRIAEIRQTHYGGFWDFTADMAHGDLAYSNQALPAHTDTTYFTDPAGLQIFHLLSHDGKGGESLLVDGFYTASRLSRSAYETLSRLSVPSHASGNPEHQLRPCSRPSIFHDDQGQLVQVRWNNEDRGVLGQGWSASEVSAWYKAAREFESLNRSAEAEYWFKLEPGTMVVIDNWRVLHGRAGFTGSRRMCGAYIGADDWHSRRRALQSSVQGRADDWASGW